MATGQLIDEDPAEALAHALAARRLASRISSVREAVGLAAYHAGEWQSAIAELRTYHRMSGAQSHLAVIADSERALGRPERAIDLFRGADQEKLDRAVAIELLIVAAGARGDLGQRDAAVAMLQVPELTTDAVQPWTARLRYAYADALLAVGRRAEAREWFSRAAELDTEAETDAAERLLELDGVVIEGDDEDEVTDELAAGPGAPGAVPAHPDAGPSTIAGDRDQDDPAGDDLTSDEPAAEATAVTEQGSDATVLGEPNDGDLTIEEQAAVHPIDDQPADDHPVVADPTAQNLAADPPGADVERDADGDGASDTETASGATPESTELGADRREADGTEEPEARQR
ncbi:tetratricopeptide repeat protein [Micromonospora sp. NPDC000442]|uniref:tetratricopeptide repeat protein n=1 Tax=Micromonospora sp. NPDC000442 TaxID=3364217 RepID=UPI0036AA2E08